MLRALENLHLEVKNCAASDRLLPNEARTAVELIALASDSPEDEPNQPGVYEMRRMAVLHEQARQHGISMTNTAQEIRDVLAKIPAPESEPA